MAKVLDGLDIDWRDNFILASECRSLALENWTDISAPQVSPNEQKDQ